MPKSFKHIRLWTLLDKICMNAKIIKAQCFHKIIYDLKCHFYVMENVCDFLLTYLWTNFVLVFIFKDLIYIIASLNGKNLNCNNL